MAAPARPTAVLLRKSLRVVFSIVTVYLLPSARLQFAAFHQVHGMIARAGGQCHIGEGRVDATGRGHATAVGDEQVFYIVTLVPGIEHGSFGIAPHARGTHFVYGEPWRIIVHEGLNG